MSSVPSSLVLDVSQSVDFNSNSLALHPFDGGARLLEEEEGARPLKEERVIIRPEEEMLPIRR